MKLNPFVAACRLFPRSAAFVATLALIHGLPASAFEWDLGRLEGKVTNKVTVGAGWRVEKQDDNLLGKLNVPGQQTACQADDCGSTGDDPAPNQRFVDLRGSYGTQNSDDGNMNYDKGDLISGLLKFNSVATANWDENWDFKLGAIGFYDAVNDDFDETHNNTLFQPHRTKRPKNIRDRVGLRVETREAFVQYSNALLDHDYSLTVGWQRVRWGESNIHPLNTLDVINPQNAILPRQPGFATNELHDPTNLALFTVGLADRLNLEAFYQLDWDATRAEPAGTYFSSSDSIGRDYVNSTFGVLAEDPDRLGRPAGLGVLISNNTRTLDLEERYARDDGQYGLRLNYYAENLNNGTEFALYAANYHSRLPYLSAIEAQESCTRRALIPANFEAAVLACSNATGLGNGLLQTSPSLATEPFPTETAKVLLEYPEDIRMFGVSFNTTALGWSFSGEYAYRPNLPVQVAYNDVTTAAVQQAFPIENIPIAPIQLAALGIPLPPNAATTNIPGARTYLPENLSGYRNRVYQPGDYIRGYERLDVGQFVLNALRVLPPTLGADEITVLGEVGFTNVFNLPKKLQFQGEYGHSTNQPGADGTGPGPADPVRYNPTFDNEGAADDFAAGVRALVQLTYNSVFGMSGLTLKPTILWFEDVYGVAPSPMQNYVEGNRWVTGGLHYQIGQNLEGTVLYQYFDGARNVLQDRDNVQVSLSYSF